MRSFQSSCESYAFWDGRKTAFLRLIESIYDPLGLVAPFTVIGKFLLQELCKRADDLDQVVKHELQLRISKRWGEFEYLHPVHFQR